MTKRFGFTLAEVLITLGIIGVVAAMTIPTLISNTNGAQFKSAYKKALSSLNQAVLMNVAMEDTDFSTLKDDSASTNGNHIAGSLGAMLEERLQSATDVSSTYVSEVTANVGAANLPKGKVEVTVECTQADVTAANSAVDGTAEAVCKGIDAGEFDADTTKVKKTSTINISPADGSYYVYALADGTYFGFKNDAANCTKGNLGCIGFIDVNGSTNPNTVIACDSGTGLGSGQGVAADAACEVSTSNVKDIYPVMFYDQTVEPASDAARTVLFGK